MAYLDFIEKSDIEIFELIRQRRLDKYPIHFWEGVNGLHAATKIIRHIFDDILGFSIDQIKACNLTEVFAKFPTGNMLEQQFNNSMYQAIGSTYPELKEWAEYNRFDERKYYTDKQMIDAIMKKYNELNRVPHITEMEEISGGSIAKRFGSWGKALIAAGLTEDIYSNLDLENNTKEQVVKHLKDICINADRIISKEEILNYYSIGLIKTHFKTLTNISRMLQSDYDEKELIDILKRKATLLNKTPDNTEMKVPQTIVFIRTFGSWENALQAAGLI
jgi:hypothetical protein